MQFINEETLECYACKYIAKTKTNFRNHLYTMRHHNNVKKLQQQEQEQEHRYTDLDSNAETESVSDVTDSVADAPSYFENESSRKVKAHEGYLASSLFCDDDAFSTTVANMDRKGVVHMENMMWGIGVCMMMTGSFMIGSALANMQC